MNTLNVLVSQQFVCRIKREMEWKREEVYVFNVHTCMCASQEPSMDLSLKPKSLPR